MSEWKMVKLGEIFEFIRNGANIKQGMNDEGLPITRIETIANRVVDRSKMGYAGIMDASKYENYILCDGDILMSHINSEKHLGKTAIYNKIGNETIIHGMNLLCLRTKKKLLNSKYANYYFNSLCFKNQIPNITKKSVNQASFTVTALKELLIPFPPLEIQQKIATVLDKASSLIELRKAQIEKLDLLVKSKFIDIFGDPVTNPMGWEKTTMNNIAKGKLTYGSGASAVKYDGVIRYIRITDISNNGKLNENVVSASEYDEKYILNDGDILFARSGATVGKTLLYRENLGKCIYAGYLIRLIPNPKYVVPDYVFAFTKTDYYMKFIEFNMKVVAQPNINAQQYGNLQICLPPLPLQTQFADFVEQVEQQKTVLNQSLKKLEMNYKALMQGCFNGELFQ